MKITSGCEQMLMKILGSTAIVPLFVDLLERKPKVGQRIKLVVSLRSEGKLSSRATNCIA